MNPHDPAHPVWILANGRSLSLDRPRVIAILNTTPDSFSDGGDHTDPDRALAAALRFIRDGADMLDIGGESTRPGAARVDEAEQIRRTVPVIRALRESGVQTPISIDSTRAAVAHAALRAGADAINDVSGGTEDASILPLAARLGCGLILMHRLAPPDGDRYSDQYDQPPAYRDVVEEVAEALRDRATAALASGVSPESIVLDPGLGFGKSVEQNAELVRATPRLCRLGFPLLGAASRKSFVARLSMDDRDEAPPPPTDRLGGSVAFSLTQLTGGIRLFRVHDVRAQASALRVAWRLAPGEGPK